MTIAVKCTEDLEEKVRGLRTFGRKIFAVYSEEDLLDKSKLLQLPAVGLMYGGIVAEGNQDRSRQGLMGTLHLSVVLIIDANTVSLDRKDEAANYLDTIRSAILTTCSPTGHKWRFVSETPLGKVGGVLVYAQRWSTAAPLTN